MPDMKCGRSDLYAQHEKRKSSEKLPQAGSAGCISTIWLRSATVADESVGAGEICTLLNNRQGSSSDELVDVWAMMMHVSVKVQAQPPYSLHPGLSLG